MKKTERLQARITPEVLDLLKDMASYDRRTVSAEVETIILDAYVARREQLRRETEQETLFV